MEWGFAGSKFLTAYTTTPGDASIVHHVTVYTLYDPDEAARMYELDDAEADGGFDCAEGPLIQDIDLVAVWNPGTGVTQLPGGSGIVVNGDLPGLIRIHYSGTGDDRTDHTTMELDLADDVTTFGYLIGLDDTHISLPPGQEGVTEVSDYHLLNFGVDRDSYVWGVNPHMHTRGYEMEVWHDPDGDPTCMERLAYWDYGWQQMFWYEKPMAVGAGDLLRLTCTYDTRGETETIHYGQTSTSEMCLTILYVTGTSG